MNKYEALGIGRSLEPTASTLQPAWKIDNSMTLRTGEMLVDVKIISINLVSFNEICDETGFDDELFKKKIIDIVNRRGKLHNPITGTGGMLFGRVAEMDSEYANKYHLALGDQIVSMTSLSVTPLKIERIFSIDYESAQITLDAKAILFSDSPVIKVNSSIPLKTLISAMDEAGAPTRTDAIVRDGDDVLILGGSGKVGLLCAFAAKRRLKNGGRLVSVVLNEAHREKLAAVDLFDEIIVMDAGDNSNVMSTCSSDGFSDRFDVVINCINKPDTELISLIAVKPHGILFFATLSSNDRLTALTAESMGKELHIIPYTGFMDGHAEFTINLIREYPKLQTLLTTRALFVSPRDAVKSYSDATDKKRADIESNGFIFTSPRSQLTLRQALKVARYNTGVLICGESGVGKEIIANIIHQNSERKSFPMVKINCAAIPENLLESELFGYEKGSFTGANAKGKIGLWESAQNGTLFLDEVGELPLSFQAKLLRAIQEKEITRVGGIKPIKVNVRIISATNQNLADMVAHRLFRDDLYYRLNAFPLFVAPLRERREDIPPLIKHFIKKFNGEFNISKQISQSAVNLLSAQPLYGNTRELQNIIQRVMIDCTENTIESADILSVVTQMSHGDKPSAESSSPHGTLLPAASFENTSLKDLLESVERDVLSEYYRRYHTTQRIADALDVSQPTIARKLKKYSIS